MTLTPQMFLIVCPMLFLAGLVDAIGGGGGLISLPAYLLAGVPMHNAIATNKLSSTCGTTLTTVRFIRQGLVNWKIAIPTIVFAMLGSSLGANLSMGMDEGIMQKILFIVLPVVAVLVMNPKRDDKRSLFTRFTFLFLYDIFDRKHCSRLLVSCQRFFHNNRI